MGIFPQCLPKRSQHRLSYDQQTDRLPTLPAEIDPFIGCVFDACLKTVCRCRFFRKSFRLILQ